MVNIVADQERKIVKDFKSSPLGLGKYPFAAVFSACIIGIIMSFVSMLLYSIYVYISVGYTFTLKQYALCFFITIIVTLMAASINALLVSFLKTINSFTAASIVIGTMVGFITGVYVPMGILPSGVQMFIKALPFGHAAVLFRNILMSDTLKTVFGQVPAEYLNSYNKLFGIDFFMNGKVVSHQLSLLFIAVAAVICFGLFILNYNRKRKEI